MTQHKHHDGEGNPYERVPQRRLGPRSSDMNVTPLIDVLLVLLVIFMATLPLTQKGMDINLPLDTKAVTSPTDMTQVVLTRAADGVITLNKQVVTGPELVDRLQSIFANRKDKTVFIEGAASLHYGDIVPLIDACSGIGLRVGIITAEMTANARRGR